MKPFFNIVLLLVFALFSCKRDSIPSVTTADISYLSYTVIRCGGDVTDDGGLPVLRKGICWSTDPVPFIKKDDNSTDDGSGTGPYYSYLRDLNMGTTYYIRAYAENEAGIAYAGEIISATTLEGSLPVLTTSPLSNITATSARSGGTVTDPGGPRIIEAGICWGTSPNPVTSGDHKSEGGVVAFISIITGLEPKTTYYVRAYASNSNGTAYGNELSFTTDSVFVEPEVITRIPKLRDVSSIECGGIIPLTEGTSITARGVCWNTEAYPDITGECTQNGSGTGAFYSDLWNLEAGTRYFVRAYATYGTGTAYGEQYAFTPPEETFMLYDERDGKRYRIILVGDQWWMAQNLDVGVMVFSDSTGSPHSGVSDNGIIEKYCPENKSGNCDLYGGLYDWDEMMGYGPSDDDSTGTTRGICPEGWHIPTRIEWDRLFTYLGGEDLAGGILKESGTAHWLTPNEGAWEGIFFDALPAGLRDESGSFGEKGSMGGFWSATELVFFRDEAYAVRLRSGNRGVYENGRSKMEAYSVRCIEDE